MSRTVQDHFSGLCVKVFLFLISEVFYIIRESGLLLLQELSVAGLNFVKNFFFVDKKTYQMQQKCGVLLCSALL